jgi:hypothetical protein
VGGLVAFGEFVRGLGVDRALEVEFGSLKQAGTTFPMASQLRLLLDAAVAGEPRVFGLEALAADPLFCWLAGGVLPSVDTVYRDLARFDERRVASLGAIVVEHGIALVRSLPDGADVFLDIDTSVLPLFGNPEGAALGPNPKYHGRPSYHPIVARVAQTDTCVGAQLRPGDTALGAEDVPFVREAVRAVNRAVPTSSLVYARIDAAGDCTDILQAIHDEKAYFVVKAKMTTDLCSAVTTHRTWTTTDRDADGRPSRQVAELSFQRKEWQCRQFPVRVIAVRTRDRDRGRHLYLWEDLDYTVQVYLTNDRDRDASDLAWAYDARAGIEPLIAEWKNAWGIGHASSASYQANAAHFLLKMLAHNLLQRFVAERAPTMRRWRTPWIRRALVRIPARLSRSGRRHIIHLPPRPCLPPRRC